MEIEALRATRRTFATERDPYLMAMFAPRLTVQSFMPMHRPTRSAPVAHGGGQCIKGSDCVGPVDASVRDALAVGEPPRIVTPRHEVLPASGQETLDHDAHQCRPAIGQLACQILNHRHLTLWILARIGMRRIHHHSGTQAGAGESLSCR